MSDYEPLVKPPDPEDIALSVAGKIFGQIPILGWSWASARWHHRWRPTFKRLKEQLEARQPLPPSTWGTDPRRREWAAFIAKEVEDKFGWPNDRFIPDDAFWVMMFPPEDDLCGLELMMDIEDRLDRPLSVNECESLYKMKFGEVVDFLLEIARKDPLPLEGPEAVEAQPCASASVFWQLRGFAHAHAGIARHDLRPGTRLRDVFRHDVERSVGQFVARHFGVRQPVRRRLLGFLPPFWSGLALYVACAAAIRHWAAALFWWYVFVVPLPLAIILSLLASWTWQMQMRTVADLVRWTLQERRRQKDNVYGSGEECR